MSTKGVASGHAAGKLPRCRVKREGSLMTVVWPCGRPPSRPRENRRRARAASKPPTPPTIENETAMGIRPSELTTTSMITIAMTQPAQPVPAHIVKRLHSSILVSLAREPQGRHLITFVGILASGRQDLLNWAHSHTKSERSEGEMTVSEWFGSHDLEIGASCFVRGNGNHIRRWLLKRFGRGAISIRKQGDGWKLTRLRADPN